MADSPRAAEDLTPSRIEDANLQTPEKVAAAVARTKPPRRSAGTGAPVFEPLNTESTSSMIASKIRGAIVNGAIGPGSQLAEVELAARLKVSRGPVREALQRLVQEGVLIAIRNRGVFVPTFDSDDVTDIYLARQAIESAAISIVIASPDADTRGMQKVVGKMQSAAKGMRWSSLAALDAEFHQQLVGATRSHRLMRMLNTLIVESRLCIVALEDAYEATDELVEEHVRIFDAIANSDSELATRLISDHMDDAARRLRNLLGS